MNTKSYLLVVLLACIATIGVNAQGVKIYKNRGSMQTINYNMLDSIVTYEKAETEATLMNQTDRQRSGERNITPLKWQQSQSEPAQRAERIRQ